MPDVVLTVSIAMIALVSAASITALVVVCRRYAWYRSVVQQLPVVRPRPVFTSSAV